MYLCKKFIPTLTNQNISDHLHLTNQSTVVYGIKKIDEDYKAVPETREKIDLLIKKINP